MKSQAKRLAILPLPEARELYSVPQLSPHEQDYFFTLSDEELAAVNRLDLLRNRIHLILMLGYFKVKRVCLIYRWKDIVVDYHYVADRYFPDASRQNKNIDRQTRSRLYSTVFDLTGYQRCNYSIENDLQEQLEKRAKYYIDESQLLSDAVTFLKSKQSAIPRYSTLQKILSKAINTEESRLAQLIDKHLNNNEGFLSLIHEGKKSLFNDLKKLAKSYKPGENKREIKRNKTLRVLSEDAFKIIRRLKLTEGNVRYFATRCQGYNASQLRELKTGKALTYLLCFVATRYRISNDILTQSFLVAYKEFDDLANSYRDDAAKQQSLELAEQIDNVPRLLDLFVDYDFGCRSNSILHQQIGSIKSALIDKTEMPAIDDRIIKRNDRKYLNDALDTDEVKQKMLHRHELYLYKLLYNGLRKGDVYVENSLEYRSFDDYLVTDRIWHQRKKYLLDIGLDWMIDTQEDHLKSLETLFCEKISMVSARIAEGNNSFIRRKHNADKLLWSRAVIAKDNTLTDKFFAHFDRKTIVNVIRKVDAETGFLDYLKPQSNRYKKAPANTENLLACLIANGTFQGTYKFSDLSGQQYKILKRIEDDHFSEDALQRAIDAVTGEAIKLSVFDDFRLDDGEVHSSADGQRFESKYGNPLVDYSAKHYGKKKGGIVYTLTASHFAVRGKVISARSHESHHLFDLVYNNTSDLKATIISTDTHGTNQYNHAILNTFGYQFTPRYARFKHRFLKEFTVNFNDGVDLSLTTPINWRLIRAEWDNIVKIMLSLGLRTVQQSTLVKKLCSFKQHSSTMLALAEYNRVLKCLHLLDYADDKQLRQVIQESLNRGEQLQGLKRALAALGSNQFRGQNPEEMVRWNQCSDLLANCIVYYNAWIMSSFKAYCLETGNNSQLRHLKMISPASWEHILLNGFYNLADNDEHWDIESELKGLRLAA